MEVDPSCIDHSITEDLHNNKMNTDKSWKVEELSLKEVLSQQALTDYHVQFVVIPDI